MDKKNIEEIEILTSQSISNVSNLGIENEDTDLQAPKVKRVQTEAQKLNTQKMREKLKEKQELLRKEKIAQDELMKAKLEEKIINKAISIKKKQIKKEVILDEISDDETPLQEIKNTIKNKKVIYAHLPPPENIFSKPIEQVYKPKYIFV